MAEEKKEPENGAEAAAGNSEEQASKASENEAPQTSPGQPAAAETVTDADVEKEAKAKAAAEARAARAAARAGAAKSEEEAEAKPKEPSPKQPLLDLLVHQIKENVCEEAVEASLINELDDHLPTLTIKSEHWYETAGWLKTNAELPLTYLRNLSGVDMETHMEIAYHLYALDQRQEVCVKVKTNRERPSVPSVTPIWAGADWNEREVFDLLGIDFPGHPNLCRIMMPDDWEGHPLRKDYEQLDAEV